MRKRSYASNTLVFLLFILAISALAGGWALISDPSGANLGFTIELLQFSPFPNFLIPGLFLFVIFGVFSLIVLSGLIWRNRMKWLEKINLFPEYHWSLTFAYLLGLLQVIWINVELYWLREFFNIHAFYSTMGVLIIFFALLPGVRKDYLL